ncbi:hypothetical protein KSP40_PGU019247 [Platanthera guangdongensis]|uniref:Uncharacterized protein n=1 Tax=Platanthera guangdongensis TaxID=2320717 RepID=A0ABR2MGP6_9ASPA
MSACCRSSPDLTLPHADQRRQLRRRPIDGFSSAVIRLRRPAVGTVGRLFVVESVLPRGSRCKWARSSRVRDRVISAARLSAVGERIGDLERDVIPVLAAEAEEGRRRSEVVAAAAMTAVLGTGNRVLYKLALVPLKQYPFFLAQLATIGYVIVYFSILYGRYRAGIVTNEMLSMPKTPFMAVGLLEALGAASGMAAGGKRYRANQVLGCILVSLGVVITVARYETFALKNILPELIISGSGSSLSLQNVGVFWILLMIASFFLQAADTVLKEKIFFDSAITLKGGSVDLFVVNSFGSAFQVRIFLNDFFIMQKV